MPDTKITALTAIGANPIIPATFPIPMVDLTDTSMAASGTTKKVTVNQILGAGGTATLASATITGDLTVDTNVLKVDTTNNRVGINNASPAAGFSLDVAGGIRANAFFQSTDGTNTGIFGTNVLAGGVIGICSGTNVPLVFGVNSTEQMRLNSTGLGVGTSPLYKLHAVVTSGAVGAFRASTAAIARLLVGNTVEDVELKVNANGDGQLTANASKYLGLGSGGINDRVILDTSGNLLVGTTTSASSRIISSFLSSSGNLGIKLIDSQSNNTAIFANFSNGTGTLGTITNNNNAGVLYNTISDYRLKESVTPLSGGLARVNALKPSIYKWKSSGSSGEGFLAHELAEVVPFAVSGEKDAVNEDGSIKSQGIDMSRVVPILVAAIQELTARVQTLETR